MSNPLPISYASPNRDADHLRLLAIFHYVVAGLSLLILGFLGLHFAFMRMMFNSPMIYNMTVTTPAASQPTPIAPTAFIDLFKWIYLFMAIVVIGVGLLNLISAGFIKQRKNRIFSLVVAGIDCMQFPFGTALGVFTFIILLRDSVRLQYEASPLQ